MLRKWGPILAVLFGAILLAMLATKPPSTVHESSAPDLFSSGRAMEYVRVIADKPHPTGSAENAKVREYIIKQLKSLDLELSISESQISGRPLERLNRWSGEEKTQQTIYNIIGVLPGKDRTKPALLLMAHHDTVWDSPGASDDTIGIAVILEILRAVKLEDRDRDLIVLFTDAEELGLAGAARFFDKHSLKDKIGTVINFEARGGGGTANLFQLSSGNGEAARAYGRAVGDPSGSSLSAYIYSILPNDTDLTPALKKDYTAYNIAIIGRAGMYHSPLITPDALDQGSVQHMGTQGLDLTRVLLASDNLPEKSTDATFFDLFGLVFVIYAPFWGWVFLGIGLLGYLLSVPKGLIQKDLMWGAAKMVFFIVLGAAVLFMLNKLSGHGPGTNYYDRLAAIPRLEFIAGFACLALFFAVFGHKEHTKSERFGVALPVILLGIAGQNIAPTATYFLSLPIMLAGITAFVMSRPSKTIGTGIAVFTGILVSGYMMGLGHLMLLGIGPEWLSVAILPAAISIMALLALYPEMPKRRVRILALILAVAAVVIALWVRFDPMAASIPTYRVW